MTSHVEGADAQETRKASVSATSTQSQTAQEYIASQLELEAEAREILPYQFDTCTNSLGPLRQTLFSCLTCNPPPSSSSEPYTAAGICYSCSISCHGEHDLVELFTRRNFVCDCGTTRISSNHPCTLRVSTTTGAKGDVRNETPSATNTYNQNFRNRFCGCGELYDAHSEKGTMFQCIGLGTVEEGGCGEDWWHAECIMGLGRDWNDETKKEIINTEDNVMQSDKTKQPQLSVIKEEDYDINAQNQVDTRAVVTEGTDLPEISAGEEAVAETEETPMPPGFPDEDAFDLFVCYKCTTAFPWIKRYAGTPGFLPGVVHKDEQGEGEENTKAPALPATANLHGAPPPPPTELPSTSSILGKRKTNDDKNDEQEQEQCTTKKARSDVPNSSDSTTQAVTSTPCLYNTLPPTSPRIGKRPTSIFLEADFRAHLCRCPDHFPLLTPHPQLLEEEDAYEPPISETGSDDLNGAPSTHGSRSLLERGEAALSTMDRVKAIEGVMVYNRLRDGLKDFLKPFAETGQAVGADDVKAYFEKLRGDDDVMKRMREEQGGGGNGKTES